MIINSVVPIVIPRDGINLSPEVVQLLVIAIFFAICFTFLLYIIKIIIFIYRRFK